MKILMVCLGNICRSPLAHGILEKRAQECGWEIEVDSAGTNGFHDGEKPDRRSISVAGAFGLDISNQVSRQITTQDLEYFDLIFAMDSSNYTNIRSLVKNGDHLGKIKLIMNEAYPNKNMNVPDPYYGGEDGFQNVYKMLDEACLSIIKNYRNV